MSTLLISTWRVIYDSIQFERQLNVVFTQCVAVFRRIVATEGQLERFHKLFYVCSLCPGTDPVRGEWVLGPSLPGTEATFHRLIELCHVVKRIVTDASARGGAMLLLLMLNYSSLSFVRHASLHCLPVCVYVCPSYCQLRYCCHSNSLRPHTYQEVDAASCAVQAGSERFIGLNKYTNVHDGSTLNTVLVCLLKVVQDWSKSFNVIPIKSWIRTALVVLVDNVVQFVRLEQLLNTRVLDWYRM